MKKLHIINIWKVASIILVMMVGVTNAQTTIFFEDFENANGFSADGALSTTSVGNNGWRSNVAGACGANNWGGYSTGVYPIQGRSLMIASAANTTCVQTPGSYFINQSTNKYAYASVNATGYNDITIEFQWKCYGEVSGGTLYDYGMITINTGSGWTNITTGGTQGNGRYGAGDINVRTATVTLPASANNKTIQVGFRWINDGSFGNAPAFTVDNIFVRGTPIASCISPTNLNVDTITKNTARFTWTAPSPAPNSGYDYYYNATGIAPTGGPSGTVVAGVTSVVQAGLNSNTIYHFWIRSKCTSSVSTWVYGGYFSTQPNYDCVQGDGQVRGTVDDGLSVRIGGLDRVADDFIVATGKTMQVKQITIDAISANSTVNQAVINIRSNNGGMPGNIVQTVTMAPSSSVKYLSNWEGYTGWDVYHLTFNIGTPFNLSAGTYWLEVTLKNTANSSNIYWRLEESGNTGAKPKYSENSGTNWQEDVDYYQMVFYVAGDCTDAVSCNPITATATKNVICPGESTTLLANSTTTGYTYTWYTDWDNSTHTGTLLGTGSSINVNPTTSTLYGVVATKSGCPTGVNAAYALHSVAVTPPPTLIAVQPVDAITCANEVQKIEVTDGGLIPTSVLNETWDPTPNNPWISVRLDIDPLPVSTDYNGQWELYTSDTYISSPDSSQFAIIGTYFFNVPTYLESALITPPVSLKDYGSPVNMTFNHVFDTDGYSEGSVEISEDGGQTWKELKMYDQITGGWKSFANESISLDSYAGKPYLLIRFRYVSVDDWFWAIDNIKITGTNPHPTTLSWSPPTGLWMDAAKTTAYTNQNTTTVYAAPTVTTTYTVSAKTAVGCPSEQTIVVTKGDTDWNGTTTNWNTASNWAGNAVPTADYCVNIPNMATKPIIEVGVDAFAKNVTVQPGGRLDIKGKLTVTDFIKNKGAAADLTVQSDANLIQDNPAAANEGSIVVKRNIKFSANRQQYNYLISPVKNLFLKDIYKDAAGNPVNVPFVLYHNEKDNKFYNSSGAYIPGRALAVKEATAAAFAPAVMSATFTGEPMNGNLSYTLVNSNTSNSSRGFNLIGNPYPSNFNLNAFYGANSGDLSPTFNLWDNTANDTYDQGGDSYLGQAYAQWNAVTPPGTGSGVKATGDKDTNSSKEPTQFVKVGQGFMAQSLTTAKTVQFTNTMRSPGVAESFFGKEAVPFDRYWLNLTSPANITSQIAVVYFEGGNDAYTVEDSRSLLGSDAIYSLVEDQPLSINGKTKFVNTDVVSLGSRHFTAGNYTVSLRDHKDGVFANGQHIYLKDKQTGTVTDLSEGNYTFMANAGVSTGRFEIIYRLETVLATDGNNVENLVVYRDGNDFIVKATDDEIDTIEIYDAVGRLRRRLEPRSTTAVIDASTFANGTYILKISQEAEISVKKIIK